MDHFRLYFHVEERDARDRQTFLGAIATALVGRQPKWRQRARRQQSAQRRQQLGLQISQTMTQLLQRVMLSYIDKKNVESVTRIIAYNDDVNCYSVNAVCVSHVTRVLAW